MIEIIIVLIVISVVFFAMRNMFQVKDKETIYGQTCVENLYGNINAFLDAATRSKGISSGNVTTYPDQYKIYLLPSTNTISLKYVANGLLSDYQDFFLSGVMPGQTYCKANNYSMILSGHDTEIRINKGLTADSQFQSFVFSGGGGFTGSVDVFQCITNASFCKHIAQFVTDARTQSLQKKLCLNINTGGLCDERDK